MPRFRYVTPTKKGRWQPTRDKAIDAAVRAGEASRDEFEPAKIYWKVMVWVEERPD